MPKSCEVELCHLYKRQEPTEFSTPDREILGKTVEEAVANRQPREIGYCRWREILSPEQLAKKRLKAPLSAIITSDESYRCGVDNPIYPLEELAIKQQPCSNDQLSRLYKRIHPHENLFQKFLKILKTIPIMN